jgi:hypothetical protein
MSPYVPRVKPRSSGWCEEEEFPISFYTMRISFLVLNFDFNFKLHKKRFTISVFKSSKSVKEVGELATEINFPQQRRRVEMRVQIIH